MASLHIFKNVAYKNKGDALEVLLRDEMGNHLYKNRANIKNRKQMKQILDDLKEKGVTFPSDWFG